MSTNKTAILSHDEALNHLDDENRDLLSYFIDLGKPWAIGSLRRMFLSAIQDSARHERDIKFSLTRFRRKRDETAFAWAAENLINLHHLSDQILRYAEQIHWRHSDLTSSVELVLTNWDTLDYPCLERNVLSSMLRTQTKSDVIQSFAWRVLRDRNRPDYPREFAARYVGRFGGRADGQLLKMEYEQEGSLGVRRALLTAMYETGYMPHGLLDSLAKSSSEIRWIARYLSRGPEIPLPR